VRRRRPLTACSSQTRPISDQAPCAGTLQATRASIAALDGWMEIIPLERESCFACATASEACHSGGGGAGEVLERPWPRYICLSVL